jgi:hypothetical protein
VLAAAAADGVLAADGSAGVAAVLAVDEAEDGEEVIAADDPAAAPAALASPPPFGVVAPAPALAAAYAVMCVLTSVRLARVASSSVAGAVDFGLPAVPAAPGVALGGVLLGAAAAESLASSSVRILSIAATSVPQLALLDAAPGLDSDDEAVGADAALLSAVRCFFSSPTCFFASPFNDEEGIASSAALACCRCSSGEALWAADGSAVVDCGLGVAPVGSAGGFAAGCAGGSGAGCCCAGGAGLSLGGVVAGDCASPAAGKPSRAAVASVVVHRVIERFISGSF